MDMIPLFSEEDTAKDSLCATRSHVTVIINQFPPSKVLRLCNLGQYLNKENTSIPCHKIFLSNRVSLELGTWLKDLLYKL